jgi:ribosomal protein L11 methyltransferase
MHPKYYFELSIRPHEYQELYAQLLLDLTNDAIEERDSEIIIRSLEPLDDIEDALSYFYKEHCKTLDKKYILTIKASKKENQDWIKEYQQSINPLQIGNFYIRASWHEKKEGLIDICIDPALAFGSGHHESTNSIIQILPKYISKNTILCDVGCGSGILAICAAKLGAKVDICDSDELAVGSAKENFQKNSLFYESVWVGSANKANKSYDVVIANIIADVLKVISNDIVKITKNGGTIILSGILNRYKEDVINEYKGCKIVESITNGEWTTLVLKKESDETKQ